APAEAPRETTLTAAISAAATSLVVANAQPVSLLPAFPNTGTVRIDAELVTYGGRSGTTFTGLTPGARGTAAAPPAAGAVVSLVTGCTPYSDSPGRVNHGQILSCVPSCGNGTVETASGEACDPGAVPTGCPAGEGCVAAGQAGECTCQVLCGNGVVDAGEECDPPGNTGDCAAGPVVNADWTRPPAPASPPTRNYA